MQHITCKLSEDEINASVSFSFFVYFPWTIHVCIWFDAQLDNAHNHEGTRRVLVIWDELNPRIRWSHLYLGLPACIRSYTFDGGYSSPFLHFCDSSCRASGWIWFLIPPKTLEVASVAMMSGLTTAGGSWRRTPPTAPVIPRCSCSLVAVS